MNKKLSGGELIEKIAELRHKYNEESDKDWARRIYQLVYLELKNWMLLDQVPIWLVWEHEYLKQRELITNQLRSIDASHKVAEKHKRMVKSEAEIKGRSIRVSIEATTLNHLFAWTMIQKLLKKEV